MASEMLSKVLDAENSDREAQKAAHEQAQITVEAGEGAVARKKAEAAKRAEEIIESAREQARANEEKARRAAEERKREVLAAAETHRADAIKAVMETVI